MAQNTYYQYKSKREDIRVIKEDYIIQEHVDECINIVCINTEPKTISLPKAYPGMSYTITNGSAIIVVTPDNNDRIIPQTGISSIGDSLESHHPNSRITIFCEKMGIWNCRGIVGYWQVFNWGLVDLYVDETGDVYVDEQPLAYAE